METGNVFSDIGITETCRDIPYSKCEVRIVIHGKQIEKHLDTSQEVHRESNDDLHGWIVRPFEPNLRSPQTAGCSSPHRAHTFFLLEIIVTIWRRFGSSQRLVHMPGQVYDEFQREWLLLEWANNHYAVQ